MTSSAAAWISPKALMLVVVGVVIPIAALAFLALGQAKTLVGRGLSIAYGENESSFKSARFEWDGDVVAKDLEVLPHGLGEAAAIRFDEVHVETPGWFWFVRNVLDRELKHAKLDRVRITLTGATSTAGLEPSLGALGPIGALSASPFEAEGCSEDRRWVIDDLQQMGLHPEATRLEIDYRVDGSDLLTVVVLETRGSSRVQLDRKSQLPNPGSALSLDQYPGLTTSETWEVQDLGFVSARNRFCAKKAGIETRRFVDRHVESVERILETVGVAVDAESRIAYRRFTRDGGKFSFGGDYAQALASDQLDQLRLGDQGLRGMNARIEHNGRANAVQWQRIGPRPLLRLSDAEPTFASLERERAGASPSTVDPDLALTEAPAGEAPASTAVISEAASADATPAATVASEIAIPATTDPTVTDATKPLPLPTASSTDNAKASSDAESANAVVPAPASPAATPVAALPDVPATPAASTPSPRIDPPKTPPVAPEQQPRINITWEKLPKYRGRLIRIWTIHNPPRTVELLSAGGELRVRARLGGGQADYTIQRDGFLRATLVR